MDVKARNYVLGIGCERGAPAEDVLALSWQAMDFAGIGMTQLLAVASIDTKTWEPAILAVVGEFDVQALFFNAARLEQETPRLKNPSELVYARIGCHGVAEAAALAVAGADAELVVAKIKSVHATAAIARIRLQKA
jgi:cobalamin biosynthesis protein CbiG